MSMVLLIVVLFCGNVSWIVTMVCANASTLSTLMLIADSLSSLSSSLVNFQGDEADAYMRLYSFILHCPLKFF